MTLFTGPLWGQSEILLKSSYITSNEPLVLYGGYVFFDNGSKQAIDQLFYLKQKHSNLILNQSRFESYFLTLANRNPEKNYSFKRWINPMSGILAAMDNYDISAQELFEDPENINVVLNLKIEGKKDSMCFEI